MTARSCCRIQIVGSKSYKSGVFLNFLKSIIRRLTFTYLYDTLRFEPMEVLADNLKAQYVSKGSTIKILDLGGGSGWYWHINTLGMLKESKAIEVFLMDAAYDDQVTESQSLISKIQGVIPEALSLIPSDSFDVVIGLDLIEHLSKSDGYLLLYEMDRIASSMQIILTPNGFVWQPPAVNNPYNAHISGWKMEEFASFGYGKYLGLVGYKQFIGPYSQLKRPNPSRFHRELVALSAILVRWFPRFAFSILYVRTDKDFCISPRHQDL